MKKQWEIKAIVTMEAYLGFNLWCIEHQLNTSDVLRAIALAGRAKDKRLGSLVKDYDSDEAKP